MTRSPADHTRRIVIRLVDDLWTEHRWDVAHELFEPDWDNGPEFPRGPEGVRAWHESAQTTFPDLRYEILDIVCDREGHAAFRWRAIGTHRGDFGPVPPTDRLIEYEGAHFITVRGGKIVDLWSINDTFGKLQQMGVEFVPVKASAAGRTPGTGRRRTS